MTTEISSTKVAGGTLRRVKHASAATKTDMTFALFTPAAMYLLDTRALDA